MLVSSAGRPNRFHALRRRRRTGPVRPSLERLVTWPSPTAQDAKASGAAGYSTASGRHPGTTLTDAAVGPRGPEKRSTSGRSPEWSTPRVSDRDFAGGTNSRKRAKREGAYIGRKLNPAWVCQLMGFPDGWL